LGKFHGKQALGGTIEMYFGEICRGRVNWCWIISSDVVVNTAANLRVAQNKGTLCPVTELSENMLLAQLID
jgi:hypothetical protein